MSHEIQPDEGLECFSPAGMEVYLADTRRLTSMDMVEVNPNLSHGEDADATADLALALTESAMGNRIM